MSWRVYQGVAQCLEREPSADDLHYLADHVQSLTEGAQTPGIEVRYDHGRAVMLWLVAHVVTVTLPSMAY